MSGLSCCNNDSKTGLGLGCGFGFVVVLVIVLMLVLACFVGLIAGTRLDAIMSSNLITFGSFR